VQTASVRKCELIAFTFAVAKPILQAVTAPDSNANSLHPLADLRRGEAAVVAGLAEVAGFEDGRGSGAVVLARLRDLGFVAGARCEVIAKMWPVGDPMVVRIGGSTFALRRAEAAAVRVMRLANKPAAHAQLAPRDTSAALA
jgi:ferrous iron transport protein A